MDAVKLSADADTELANNCTSDDSEEQAETYSSDFEGDQDEKCLINVEHNVSLTAPEHLRDQLKQIRASVLTADEKNKQFSTANLPKDFKFISEIFKMHSVSTANDIGQNRFLTLTKKDANQIMLALPIACHYSTAADNVYYDYSIWRHEGSSWSLLPVTFKDSYVEFYCGRLNYFGVVCCPRKIKNIVAPCGSSMDIGGNCQITLAFEKECVKQNENFIYSVQEPEFDYGYSDKYTLITNASYKISFEYDKSKFVKPIKIVLGSSNNATTKEEVVFQLIGYVNETITIRKRATARKDGTYFGKLQGVDGACFVAVKKKRVKSTTDERLTKELDLVYQRRVLCHILLFYHKKINTTLYFTAECCLVNDKDNRTTKYKTKGDKLIFESKNLYLPTHQRMRIRPTSCIGTKPGNAAHFVFYFISASKENYVTFNVEAKRHIGGNPNAMLEFSTDNKQNLEIAKAEFNLDSLFFQRKNKKTEMSFEIGPPLQETQDTINDSERIVEITEETEIVDTSISSEEDIEDTKHAEEKYDDDFSEQDNPTDEINNVTCSPEIPSPEITTVTQDRYEQ